MSYRMVAVLMLIVAAGGCARYLVERPTSAAGQVCALACDEARDTCLFHANARATSNSCPFQDKIDRHCNNYTQAKDQSRCQAVNQASHPCVTPTSGDGVSSGECNQRWRDCVVECGGRVSITR